MRLHKAAELYLLYQKLHESIPRNHIWINDIGNVHKKVFEEYIEKDKVHLSVELDENTNYEYGCTIFITIMNYPVIKKGKFMNVSSPMIYLEIPKRIYRKLKTT